MSYIFLLMASFTGAFALGFTKFFGMTYLSAEIYGPASKSWVIQAVGSLMTFGPTLAYVVAGPLAASSRKWKVMLLGTACAASAVMLASALSGSSVAAVWAGLFAVGFSMGIFSAGKMSSAPLEAEKGVLSIFAVNAGLSVAFLGGILSGSYFGTLAYEQIRYVGAAVCGCLFLLTAALALPCRYKDEENNPFSESLGRLGAETMSLLLKFPHYLLSSPLLWAVAGATALAITAFAESEGLGSAAACSLMSLYAALGTIIGNLASPAMASRRFVWAFVLCAAMTAMVAGMPLPVLICLKAGMASSSTYYVVAGYLVVMGVFFGAATNLVDSELLRLVRLIGREGEGAALQSAMISLLSFLVGGTIGVCIFCGWLGPVTQFLILGLLAAAAASGFLLLALLSHELDPALRVIVRNGAMAMLSIRYKVKIEGLARLPTPARNLLILPNHPAEMDPVILTVWLWSRCAPRPVVTEAFFNDRILGSIIRLTGAFGIPDMEAGVSRYKTLRIERAISAAIDALRKGDNVLMYPSGRLATSGYELLGAASGVSRILRAAPEARVVMVRTRGLRGSSFSKALTGGATPDFVKAAKDGFFAAIRNLVFLTPKRHVRITVEVPADFPRDAGPLEINQYLEKFYNAEGEEPLSLVPLDFWTGASPASSSDSGGAAPTDISKVEPKTAEAVRRLLSAKLEIPLEKLRTEAKLAEDLGIDSLKKAEILVLLETEFFASNIELASLRTVADVILAASGAMESGAAADVATPPDWLDDAGRPPVLAPEGSTLQEAFLLCCDRMGNVPAMADDIRGVVRWRHLKTSALAIAEVFRKLPGEKLGIMAPASVGASVCTIAALLAGKVPVMMNWTVGRRNMEAAAKLAGVEKVVTSGAFLDKLVVADFGEVESKLVFVEELRGQIGLPERLSAALQARRCAARLMDELGLEGVRPDDPAVVIFTSGSESAPKGVPLSHRNILANLRASAREMRFAPDDVLLAILPPFHSFGFTACTIFPLVGGLKVAYYPNPTDGGKVAQACRKWRGTTFLGTPTFAASALKAPKDSLRTLRRIIVGAEKAPESLFRTVEALGIGAQLLEGYGITECSPILTLNRAGEKPEGVGRPLPGVELIVVDLDTRKPLPAGQRGLVLARGESIFSGYLGGKPDPFLEVDGRKWYSTGDLGWLAPSGALVLAGRLKRFVKVGGEMVSLPAIEEELSKKWPAGEEGPNIAVTAVEKDGARPELILFTSSDVSKDAANDALAAGGFSNIYRIARVVRMDALPLLGSGKTDYQRLLREAKGA